MTFETFLNDRVLKIREYAQKPSPRPLLYSGK